MIMQNAGLPEAGDCRTGGGRKGPAIIGFRQVLEERCGQARADFHRLAAAIVRPRAASWKELWDKTVAAETERTREQLAAVASGDPAHLGQATVVRTTPGPEPRAFGMCGRLRTWTPLPSNTCARSQAGGGGPTVSRTMTRLINRAGGSGAGSPRTCAMTLAMASRPCTSLSTATVDRAGVAKRPSSSSSQPNTLTSPGTRQPRESAPRTAPMATWSFTATTAVTPHPSGSLRTAS
ncbi:hypothetical protein HD596_010124 [Nonomuraea jabiensis]|uniref:Uncharacterized protein n=1 Tax=Nonomuraea jabiensis TaxID=882448 RepID=A0A7W9GGN9_9ACTN|nr:hypothetical protein [Nonomuraea jabiensis]MBB5783368.1 hypothetical protein [Nonomuraea jabiensis]